MVSEGILPSWTSLWQNTTGDGVAASNTLLDGDKNYMNRVGQDRRNEEDDI